jgi:hypothetical protein
VGCQILVDHASDLEGDACQIQSRSYQVRRQRWQRLPQNCHARLVSRFLEGIFGGLASCSRSVVLGLQRIDLL